MNSVRKFSAEMGKFDEMLDFIEESAVKCGFEIEHTNKIRLASEEAVVNIINYAYPNSNGHITIQCQNANKKNGIIITLIDTGIPYNPLKKVDPNINIPVEEREIGGLGILIIKKIMNKVDYRREDNKNIFILTKFISQEENLDGK